MKIAVVAPKKVEQNRLDDREASDPLGPTQRDLHGDGATKGVADQVDRLAQRLYQLEDSLGLLVQG